MLLFLEEPVREPWQKKCQLPGVGRSRGGLGKSKREVYAILGGDDQPRCVLNAFMRRSIGGKVSAAAGQSTLQSLRFC